MRRYLKINLLLGKESGISRLFFHGEEKQTRSKRYLKKFANQSGFTIVELIVVMVIIALLATIVLINLEQSRIKSRDAKRKADLALISTALENYRVDQKEYPIKDGLTNKWCGFSFVADNTCFDSSDVQPLNRYINSLPEDPLSKEGSRLFYQYRSDKFQYKLIAQSEGISDTSAGDCLIGEVKQKAGEYCDPKDKTKFQVSSSNDARNWEY